MKLLKYIICAAALVLGLASCSVTRHSAYTPTLTQLSIQMDDLEYLGEVEISIEYRRYLGIFTVTDSINGEEYDRKEIKSFPIYNNGYMTDALLPGLQKASSKILEVYPKADYFIVTNQTTERVQLFLGSQVVAKAKVKAYSLK